MKRIFVAILFGLGLSTAQAQTIFNPVYNTPTVLSATTTSANGPLANLISDQQVRVYSTCSNISFVKFSNNSGVIATLSDIPVAPLSIEIFTVPTSYTYAAVVLSSGGPCDVYFLRGGGL